MDVRNLTEALVRELRSRATGRTEVGDAKVPALRLRLSPTSASWYVRKRPPGGLQPVRVLLGKVDDLTVATARARALQVVGEQLAGRDHAAEKRARRQQVERDSLTLEQGWAIYLAEKSLRPATVRTYERDLRVTFGDYWDRPLAELTPEIVRIRHRDRVKRVVRAQARVGDERDRKRITASPARADGAVRALRALVRYLRITRSLSLPDVAEQIVATKGWGNVGRRKRALLGDALVDFVHTLRALPGDELPDLTGTQRDLALLLLCTGLRWDSARALRWSEVDFRSKTLTVPADRMKGKVEHSLPLGPGMVAMLEARKQEARSGQFVFPGLAKEVNGKPVLKPIAQLSRGFLAKILDREGVVITWSPHDLRRSALTLLESLDVSAYALKRIAAHSAAGDVTAGYIVHDVDRLRGPMERLERAVQGDRGQVVTLRRRS